MNTVEVITIVDPGLVPWWILALAAIPFVLGIVLSVIDDTDYDGTWALIGFGVSVVSFLVTLAILGTNNSNNWTSARSDALEKSGYTQVDMSGMEFDAVKDGERVIGLLRDVEGSNNQQYQIVIIPPVEGK